MIHEFHVQSNKQQEVIDITDKVQDIVDKTKVYEGMCIVYVPHATAAVIINENYDPNIMLDFIDSLEENIPSGVWRHDKIDGNGSAHIKSSIVGPSETVMIKDGKLLLGTWQNICLCCFDGPRKRRVLVKVFGC